MWKTVPYLVAVILLQGACSRSARYYVDKGDKLFAKGSYADAELNYRKATQKDSTFGPAFYQLGLSELRLGKPPEAYTALSRAADLLPNREDVKVTLADLSLQAYLGDRRRPVALYNKADALADQLLAKDARSYHGLRLKAHLAATDRKLDYAEELYRRANETKPLQREVIMAWTEVMLADGHAQQAEDLAFQFLQKDKTYVPIYNLLFQYFVRSNQFAEAEKILKSRSANNAKVQPRCWSWPRSMPRVRGKTTCRLPCNIYWTIPRLFRRDTSRRVICIFGSGVGNWRWNSITPARRRTRRIGSST